VTLRPTIFDDDIAPLCWLKTLFAASATALVVSNADQNKIAIRIPSSNEKIPPIPYSLKDLPIFPSLIRVRKFPVL
jgi:hypothetical protein